MEKYTNFHDNACTCGHAPFGGNRLTFLIMSRRLDSALDVSVKSSMPHV